MSHPRFVPASGVPFRFEGRFDFSDPLRPAVVWQGSRISLDFEGSMLRVCFGGSVEQNVFDLTVDKLSEIIVVPAGPAWRFAWPHKLGNTRHQLTLCKRSEAAAGQVRFAGVEIGANAKAWLPPVIPCKLRMEFFGDSITVGACNEDQATDQWEDRRTHNHALSYSSLTAAAFHADYRCMAVSGMGIVTGYVDVKAGEVWDKVYPRADSPRADLKAWQPDVVLVNLGENDDSFSRSINRPFPSEFTSGYVALVKAIRAAYAQAHLVLLRGGMYGGAKSPELRTAWEAAIEKAGTGDPGISHFVFAHWSSDHPRVSDHRAMANELTSWLKAQPFMSPFL